MRLVVLALSLSFTTHATSDEDLDCLKLTPEEKFDLTVGSLAVAIRNSSFDSVIKQSEQLLSQAQTNLAKQGKKNCPLAQSSLNFNASGLTKLTAEEIKATYERALIQTQGQEQCQKLLQQVFVPALIVNKAINNQETEQARGQMQQLLKQIM